MEGTTLSHVGAWAKGLVFRRPSRVPRPLRSAWFLLAALIVLAVMAVVNYVFGFVSIPSWAVKVGWLAWLLLGTALAGFLIHVAGDAARYLHVAPANIEIRCRIREAGIRVLKKLHASLQYDRIIVVGHSLGSVIGYDILTHLWTRYHDICIPAGGNPTYTALHALEAMARETLNGSLNVDQYQTAQSDYLVELKKQGHKWLVTDFVTLGSPLAHAAVLMARNEQDFGRKKEEREFPTCPPVLEEVTTNRSKIKRFAFEKGNVWVPHHAAAFAPTRWTNLYFPCRLTFWGDVIGGPLAPVFGLGIRDVPVKTDLRFGLFSHTLYWSLPKNRSNGVVPSWVVQLRQAVRICQTPTE